MTNFTIWSETGSRIPLPIPNGVVERELYIRGIIMKKDTIQKSAKAKSKPFALVGVSDEGLPDKLLPKAQVFTERAGLGIRMLHVCRAYDFSVSNAWIPESFTENPQLKTSFEYDLEMRQYGKMRKLAQQYLKSENLMDRAGEVDFGLPSESLQRKAAESGASLLICGAPRQEPWWVQRPEKTALNLVRHPTIPTLIIPEDAQLQLDKERMKIVMLDDLQPGSRALLDQAQFFAERLTNSICDVAHIHVYSKQNGWLYWLRGNLNLLNPSAVNDKRIFTKEYSKAVEFDEIHDEMFDRSIFLRQYLYQVHGHYRLMVETHNNNNSYQDLVSICDRERPDLIICCPSSHSRSTYESLLNLHSPILFTPEIKEAEVA